MDQTLLLVDEKDKFLGYAPRKECHSGEGKRHRAFVTLLFDSKNQVLLQKRKHRLFDNFWDLTAISHPLHFSEETKSQRAKETKSFDESYQEASDRALKKEMGIAHVAVKKVGAFNYFAKDGENCENEYCAVLVGRYDGRYKPNPDEAYETKQIDFDQFVVDVKASPSQYTPWAVLAVKQLKNPIADL